LVVNLINIYHTVCVFTCVKPRAHQLYSLHFLAFLTGEQGQAIVVRQTQLGALRLST
jgi:ABC-type molybdate transport system substrate-binding protein